MRDEIDELFLFLNWKPSSKDIEAELFKRFTFCRVSLDATQQVLNVFHFYRKANDRLCQQRNQTVDKMCCRKITSAASLSVTPLIALNDACVSSMVAFSSAIMESTLLISLPFLGCLIYAVRGSCRTTTFYRQY